MRCCNMYYLGTLLMFTAQKGIKEKIILYQQKYPYSVLGVLYSEVVFSSVLFPPLRSVLMSQIPYS